MERIRNQIIQALCEREMSIYELIDHQDASIPEFFNLIRKMEDEGILSVENGFVRLKDRNVCEGLDGFEVYCKICDGTGYEIRGLFNEVLREYSKIAKDRPEAIEKFDQGFISLDGVIRRVEFVFERGDLLRTEIFVVGDDDLFSIASALTGLPKRIHVVDIDERLIDFINRKADEYGFPISANVYDVQRAFPDELKGKFDVFVTDPVETIPGIKLFLSRGVSTLKGVGCSGYFGLTTLEASRRKWYEIQRMIHEMGFVITDIRRKFNVYPQDEKNFFRYQEKLPIVRKVGVGVDYNWYKSSLYRIEAVKEPKPLVEGEMIIDEAVYKDDESWATPY